VVCSGRCASGVVDEHAVEVVRSFDLPVDEHHGHAGAPESERCLVLLGGGREDDPVDEADEAAQKLVLALDALVRVAQVDPVAALAGDCLDALDDGCEVGVGDVRDDDAERACSPRLEAACQRVRPKVERLDRLADARFRADSMAAEVARDRGDRDAGAARDVADRRDGLGRLGCWLNIDIRDR